MASSRHVVCTSVSVVSDQLLKSMQVHVIGTPTHINAPALLSSDHGNTTFGDMCTAEISPRGSRRDAFDLVKQPSVDSLCICICVLKIRCQLSFVHLHVEWAC